MIIIKSQNRGSVVKANFVYVSIVGSATNEIKCDTNTIEDFSLGDYESEKRVKEVMDMIEEHITNLEITRLSAVYFAGQGGNPFDGMEIIFTMPKEQEIL